MWFKELQRRKRGRTGGGEAKDERDAITKWFGETQPSDLPETSTWWKRQQKDLAAIADITEHGVPQAMITVTQNDSSPELLAAVRRGPGAQPTETEYIEYLKGIRAKGQERPLIEHYSVEHVLSYQRRIHATKQNFFRRNFLTPLGIVREWWVVASVFRT